MSEKKIAIIGGDFGAQHAYHPMTILRTLSYEPHYVSPGKLAGEMVKIVFHWSEGEQTYREQAGRPIPIGADWDEVSAESYAGAIIPGARAPEYLSTNEEARSLVRDFNELNKPIVGMCHGPLLLAASQIVEGVKCTGIPATRPWLELAGAEWVQPTPLKKRDQRKAAEYWYGVCVDDNIITAPLKVEFPNVMREFLKQVEGSDTLTLDLDVDNHLLV